MRIKKKTPLHEALTLAAQKAVTKKGTFYFFPVWFQEAGEYDLKLVKPSELPDELKQAVAGIVNDKRGN